ncbi:hypothetical protein CYMTET_11847, partial [Cymbomonas tetramitiformis]
MKSLGRPGSLRNIFVKVTILLLRVHCAVPAVHGQSDSQGGQNLDEARLREGGEGWTSPGFDDSTLANGTWLWVYNKENNEWTPKWSPAAEVGPGSLHQDSYDGREPREILDDWPSSVVRNERTLHSDAPDLSNSGNSPAGDHQSGSPDPSCRGINRSSKCSASTDEDDESEDGYSAGVSYSDSDGKISEDSGEQEKGSQKGKGKQKNKERERVKDKPLDRSTKQKGTKAVKDVVEPQPPSGAVMRFSDVSLWIIGPSGSVFERFWNGMHWVYIPHTMPNEADSAVSLHYLNHTIIVVSKQGNLYHRLMNDRDRKLLWRDCGPQTPIKLRGAGAASVPRQSFFITTLSGHLWELQSLRPLKWMNHQHPAGVTLAEVVDTGSVQPNLVFAVGTDGELYEYEPPTESSQAKKLRWKHHGRGGGTSASIDSPIAANAASAVRVGKSDGTSLAGCSLFLRMENGRGLYERRFDKGRWRWHVHQAPKGILLTGPTQAVSAPDVHHGASVSISGITTSGSTPPPIVVLAFTTSHRMITLAYRVDRNGGEWIWQDPVSVAGMDVRPVSPMFVGRPSRQVFMLNDGRLADRSLRSSSGSDEKTSGKRRRSTADASTGSYEGWIVYEVPESEGGNAEYCTVAEGPGNCLEGTI